MLKRLDIIINVSFVVFSTRLDIVRNKRLDRSCMRLDKVTTRLEKGSLRFDFIISVLKCVLTHSSPVLTDKTGSEETSDEDNCANVIGDQKPVKISTSAPFLDQHSRPFLSVTRKIGHTPTIGIPFYVQTFSSLANSCFNFLKRN